MPLLPGFLFGLFVSKLFLQLQKERVFPKSLPGQASTYVPLDTMVEGIGLKPYLKDIESIMTANIL